MADFYITSNEFSVQERQTKTKGKVYDVFFRVVLPDGTQKQKRLCGYATKTLAKAGYSRWVSENAEFIENYQKKKVDAEKDSPTVDELWNEYIRAMWGQNKESTIYNKISFYDNCWRDIFGSRKYSSISVSEWTRWQDDLLMSESKYHKKIKITSANTILRYARSFTKWCSDRYGCPDRMAEVRKPTKREPKLQHKRWTHEEVLRFLSVIDDPMWKCFFTMLYFTGRRKGEVIALSKNDITDSEIFWRSTISRQLVSRENGEKYKITPTKEDKEQRLPYAQAVRDAMSKYTPDESSPFYFSINGHPFNESSVRKAMERYTCRAGLPAIRIHDLRGSMATNLCDKGVNPALVAELIGDTIEVVMKSYYTPTASALKKTIDEFA